MDGAERADGVARNLDTDTRWRIRAVAVFVVLLIVASIHQALAATNVLALGDEPGEGPALAALAAPAWFVLFLGGWVLLGASLGKSAVALANSRWSQALPMAVAAFALTHAASFDPYYAPGLHRYWSAIGWAPATVAALVVVGIVLALSARFRPGMWVLRSTALTMFGGWYLALVLGIH